MCADAEIRREKAIKWYAMGGNIGVSELRKKYSAMKLARVQREMKSKLSCIAIDKDGYPVGVLKEISPIFENLGLTVDELIVQQIQRIKNDFETIFLRKGVIQPYAKILKSKRFIDFTQK